MKPNLFYLLPLLVGLSSCTIVSTKTPVGSEPFVAPSSEWAGSWIVLGEDDDSKRVDVSVSPEQQSELLLHFTEGEESKSIRVWLRSEGEAIFANVRTDEDEKSLPPGSENYTWARIKQRGDHLMVWLPDTEKVAARVRSGEWEGVVTEGGSVILGNPDKKMLESLASDPRASGLYHLDKPIIFVKASAFKDSSVEGKGP